MKNSLFLLFLIISFFGFSQTVPQKINYQGIARRADGSAIANKTIGIRFRLLQGSPTGSQVFIESQNLSTGPLGVFSTQIGVISSLSAVSWTNGPFFLEVGIDTTNSTNFIVMGTQELVSTPYALYAASAPSPSLGFNNGVLSVGPGTITIPSASSQSTTINTSGATTSTLTGTTYNINTPSVTVRATESSPGIAAGLAQVLGTYPNFSVLVAPTIVYNPTVGLLQLISPIAVTPSYNLSYDITPKVIINGSTLSVGPASNSVTLPSLGGGSTPTLISSGGLVNITSPVTNSFDINVQPAVFTNSGSAVVTGAYPNFTVFAPTGLTPVNIGGSGAITVGGAYPNVTVSTPSVNVSSAPGSLGSVSGSFPNYVVNTSPTFSYNNAAGALVVANSASPNISYTYNVTQTLVLQSGVLSVGPSSNSVALSGAVTPTIVGVDAASVTPSGSSFTVSVPITTVVGTGGATVTGSAPNFTVDAPLPATISGSDAVNVFASGNSYTVSAPVTTVVGIGGATVTGSAPNFTVDAPLPATISSSGAVNVLASGNNYTVSAPVTTVVGIGGATVTGTAPNFTVNAPPKVTVSGGALVYPSGLLQVMGSSPNYSLLVTPTISYSQLTGSLTLSSMPATTPAYSYAYNITPNLSSSNNVIQSGPTTNTIALVTPAAQAFAISGSAVLVAGGSILMSSSFTKQSATSEMDVFVHTQASTGIGLGNFTFEIVIDGNSSTVSTEHTLGSNTTDYITLKAIFAGLSAGSHTVGIKATPSGLGVLTTLNPNGYGAKLILKETY